MPTISTAGLALAEVRVNNDNVLVQKGTGLPIDGSSTTNQRMIYRVSGIPCRAGDVFEVHGEASFMNNTGTNGGKGYNVGIGVHLVAYAAGISGAPWILIGNEGENVIPAVHHLPMDITRWWRAPADWPEGQPVAFGFVGDAHADAHMLNGGGETIKLEDRGLIVAKRWTKAPDDPDVDQAAAIAALQEQNLALEAMLGELDTRTGALADRLTALEAAVQPVTCPPPAAD